MGTPWAQVGCWQWNCKVYFAEAVQDFIASGKPVIGICNGFQALVKAGLLPEPDILTRPDISIRNAPAT